MKTSVALIGFMGTGKTTVGKKLAARLGKEFVELDAEIEKAAGKSIAAVFHDEGESYFRNLEIEAVKKIAGKKNIVVACGGGIVLNDVNIFNLKRECVIVCLSAAVPEILKRTSGGKRPLLNVADREKTVKELLEKRLPLYRKAADITIDTYGIDAPGVVDKIINALGNYENHG